MVEAEADLLDEPSSPESGPTTAPDEGSAPPRARRPYSSELRAVGQAIEALRLVRQELEIAQQGDDYLVWVPASAVPRRFGGALLGIVPVNWADPSEPPVGRRTAERVLELRFTPEAVKRLEQRGRSRRKTANGVPDPFHIAQMLRALGDYLEMQGAQDPYIFIRGQEIHLVYVNAAGQRVAEDRRLAWLHDLWARMYLRRGLRNGVSAPDTMLDRLAWRSLRV